MKTKEQTNGRNFYLMLLRYQERNRELRIRIVPPSSEQLGVVAPRRKMTIGRLRRRDDDSGDR